MINLRKYGKQPFNVAVIHGGPGAPGGMAPVARELSSNWGILEPLQTAMSLEGQLKELKEVLEDNGNFPINLIGSSWGAMLSFIFTAYNPELVNKLILIGSGVYEEKYAVNIMDTRIKRLNDDERKKVYYFVEKMNDPTIIDKNSLMRQFGDILTKADAYNPFTLDTEVIECQYELHNSVWKDVKEFRASGELLELGKSIQCPVVAIHGDYDPHPLEGIQKPLSSVIEKFSFYLLENCGHLPWIEKYAKEKFFEILKEELTK